MAEKLYLLKVWHSAEYCCLDHDDLLWSGHSKEERDKFCKEWAERRARSLGATPNSPHWETAMELAYNQLSYTTEEPEIVQSGTKCLETISVDGDVDSVLEGITKLKEIAASKYNETGLRIEIHEPKDDYDVRKVCLYCQFKLHSDGTEDRYNYSVALVG